MYQDIIKNQMTRMGYIGKYDPRHIEAYMRIKHGCLYGLSRANFMREIEIGRACVDADGVDHAESLAKSYGL